MDRERAETFLRLLAEEELRRVTANRRDSAPPDIPDGEGEAAALLRRPAAAAMLRDLPTGSVRRSRCSITRVCPRLRPRPRCGSAAVR